MCNCARCNTPWSGGGDGYMSTREQEEQEAITARAVAWLSELSFDEGEPVVTCLCNNDVHGMDFESHAETCRALRREVE